MFEVAVPVVRRSFSHGCLVSLVVTPSCSFPTSWRSGMLVGTRSRKSSLSDGHGGSLYAVCCQ
ncbi:hypothetical protein Taro_022492 [Colocasia esculenta]|uniref:Uncharacterized protein n=1 Tax=Colocasia esculenta TaxID=4460 RepID=A0A843V1Q3_COLES|nr:hypothetical protein [Colocasia esculenta]